MDNGVEEGRERMDRRRQVQHGGLVAHGGGHRESCRMEKENYVADPSPEGFTARRRERFS